MRKRCVVATMCLLACGLACGVALGQDSVSKQQGLPGDAVDVYSSAEQTNDYVVDLSRLRTSWGTVFGIAPIVKSSKISVDFFDGAFSAQAMSRTLLRNAQFARNQYMVWRGQGMGVNDDPTLNDPGTMISTAGLRGLQLAVAFSEFGGNTNSIIGARVNYLPTRPSRLYVSRHALAVNGFDSTENRSQFGLGAIDAHGNGYFRGDGFGASGPNPLQGNNYYRVDLRRRANLSLNVIDDTGATDGTSTDWLLQHSGTVHNTPSCVPEDMAGRGVLIGANFNGEYVYESSPGFLSTSIDHRAGSTDHRGTVSFNPVTVFQGLPANPFSVAGTGALYMKDGASLTKVIGIWGVNRDGSVKDNFLMTPPGKITDNDTGFEFPAGGPTVVIDEFVHYRSQTPFRGGNGPVAVGRDPKGRTLVATVVVSNELAPADDNPVNAVAVARFDNADPAGTLQWTVATYTDFPGGKPILDGPGGNVIGQVVELNLVTGGGTNPFGPSHSAPMFDAAGNIWLLSSVELFDPQGGPSDFDIALLRAVYDPDTFSYQLELVLQLGQVIRGQNSTTDYRINFLEIADSNSVSSGTAWSGNILPTGVNGMNARALKTSDPRTLGGLVLWAEIIYDVNRDGQFIKVTGSNGDPNSLDQEYNVLLFLGAMSAAQPGNTH